MKILDHIVGHDNPIPMKTSAERLGIGDRASRVLIQSEPERNAPIYSDCWSGGIPAIESEPLKIPQMETIKRTAEIFGLPVHFIRAAVANGDVVAIRAGRKFLVNIDSVIAFLNTGIPQGAASQQAAPQTEIAPRISPISLR